MPENEFRYAAFEVLEAENGLAIVKGTVIRYGDVATAPWGTEEIRAGTFGDVAKGRFEANRRHIEDQVLGISGQNLKIFDNAERMTAELTMPDTQLGRETLAEIKAGLITGMSLELRADKQFLTDNYQHRVITGARWRGFGLVGVPAYPGSVLEQRDWRPRLLELGYELPKDEEPEEEEERAEVYRYLVV